MSNRRRNWFKKQGGGINNDFIFEVTVTAGQSFRLPSNSSIAIYNYVVDWGDGSPTNAITTYNDANRIHTYTNSGSYNISINGIFQSFTVAAATDIRSLITKIINWGNIDLYSIDFNTCLELTEVSATDTLNTTNITSFASLFSICLKLHTINNLENWEVSNITNMGGAFGRCEKLVNAHFTNWDTSSVTQFRLFMDRCYLWNPTMGSGFTVTNCIGDNYGMFEKAYVFNQPQVANWDVTNWSNLTHTFYLAKAFNQDISGWNVTNITNASYFLREALAFNQDLSSWQVQNMTDMTLMLFSTAWTTQNYDLALNAWSLLSVKPNVPFRCSATYTIATSQTARDILTSPPNNWIITDGGGI